MPSLSGFISGKMFIVVCLGLSMLAAAAVYALALIVLKAFVREDIMMLPKGEKLCAVLEKLRIIK